MTKTNNPQPTLDPDEAISKRIIERAKAINMKLVARLVMAGNDLDVGGYRAALGGLDGIERELNTMRSLLLLLL